MAEKKLEKYIKDFFEDLGVVAQYEIINEEEEIKINMETEDSGMIIGYHGETLEGLQLVLALMLAKKMGAFKRVSIEVGDYKKNREEWLGKMANDAKERALAEQHEVRIEDLKAWERRVIHMLLAEDEEVVSESSGEGRERVLVVRPK